MILDCSTTNPAYNINLSYQLAKCSNYWQLCFLTMQTFNTVTIKFGVFEIQLVENFTSISVESLLNIT